MASTRAHHPPARAPKVLILRTGEWEVLVETAEPRTGLGAATGPLRRPRSPGCVASPSRDSPRASARNAAPARAGSARTASFSGWRLRPAGLDVPATSACGGDRGEPGALPGETPGYDVVVAEQQPFAAGSRAPRLRARRRPAGAAPRASPNALIAKPVHDPRGRVISAVVDDDHLVAIARIIQRKHALSVPCRAPGRRNVGTMIEKVGSVTAIGHIVAMCGISGVVSTKPGCAAVAVTPSSLASATAAPTPRAASAPAPASSPRTGSRSSTSYRRPADHQRGRDDRCRPQRGDLQLPGASRAAARGRAQRSRAGATPRYRPPRRGP